MSRLDEHHVDVAVIGGGLGGVAAALAACRAGRTVLLSEPTDWLGGQLTSQAVPPDEHPWIESFGCTREYRRLRNGIRAYYRRHYPLTDSARRAPDLNPGAGSVSRLCHEPRVAVAVIDEMLAPHRSSGRLIVLHRHTPVRAELQGDRVSEVLLDGPDGPVAVTADYVLDATETGDLLDLAKVEHVTGFESGQLTGEPHAPQGASPDEVQAASWCFVVEHRAGEDHTIDKPPHYGEWRGNRPAPWQGATQLGLAAPDPRTGELVDRTFTPNPDPDPIFEGIDPGDRELWLHRRIRARRNFVPDAFDSDLVLVNTPMIDYLGGPLFGGGPGRDAEHHEAARELALSWLYWLQTEAPRPDGGVGWPGLRLRGDVVGTHDGLAMAPYHRESRRIVALHTVTEIEIAGDHRSGPARTDDTVGVGSYRIDLHPSTSGRGYIDIPARPFEIPLASLVPIRVRNLLPAAKNPGTTHITNGCFRVHPVEWNVGEVAGHLAAFCLERRTEPQHVAAAAALRTDFQSVLDAEGIERHWPEICGW